MQTWLWPVVPRGSTGFVPRMSGNEMEIRMNMVNLYDNHIWTPYMTYMYTFLFLLVVFVTWMLKFCFFTSMTRSHRSITVCVPFPQPEPPRAKRRSSAAAQGPACQ